jgi:hypothetical protein
MNKTIFIAGLYTLERHFLSFERFQGKSVFAWKQSNIFIKGLKERKEIIYYSKFEIKYFKVMSSEI